MSSPPTEMPTNPRVAAAALTQSGSATPLLQARGLALQIEGRTLWHKFDLTLHAGERLGITGPSGSGKTLLLRTLAGLEPLQQGALTFEGRALTAWPMPQYRARVAYLSQRTVLRESRVDAALRAPFAFRVRHGTPFPAERAQTLLASLGRNADFLRLRTERLSGGEAQIVSVIRALLVAPDILLLDEPTASLDPGAVEAIERLVTDWLSERPERACLWTSHDRAQLARTCDRLLALDPAA